MLDLKVIHSSLSTLKRLWPCKLYTGPYLFTEFFFMELFSQNFFDSQKFFTFHRIFFPCTSYMELFSKKILWNCIPNFFMELFSQNFSMELFSENFFYCHYWMSLLLTTRKNSEQRKMLRQFMKILVTRVIAEWQLAAAIFIK